MHTPHLPSFLPPRPHGIGAALFISLVFLFTLTIIGLAGMQNTILQEKMAGNMRDRSLAFQAAESALRAGETTLANLGTRPTTFVCSSASDGLYNNSAPGSATDCPANNGWPSSGQASSTTNPMHSYSVDNENFWKNNTDLITLTQFGNLSDSPKYVMEALSSGSAQSGVGLEAGVALKDEAKYYRVTAHGVGVTGNATVVLQSVVRY